MAIRHVQTQHRFWTAYTFRSEGNFAADTRGDVDHLLNAMDGGSKTRKDDALGSGTRQFFDARNHRTLGRRNAGALDVCRIGK